LGVSRDPSTAVVALDPPKATNRGWHRNGDELACLIAVLFPDDETATSEAP
jgi:hypothetical protein